MKDMDKGIIDRARNIKFIMLDVDGVLTDGRIIFSSKGEELKCFNAQDGCAMVLAQKAGIKIVFVTGRTSKIVKRRAKEHNVTEVFQGVINKIEVMNKLMKKYKVTPEEIAFLGDDLVDIAIMKKCGFAVAVADAVPEVKEIAHYLTQRGGGKGAIREILDLIIKAQGKWEEVTKSYYEV